MPGKPRPAPVNPVAPLSDLGVGAKRLVVAGVVILAGRPLVCGAPIGGTGETTAGACWTGSNSDAGWADPIDQPPSRPNPTDSAPK